MALARWLATGSAMLRGTDGRAARWTIAAASVGGAAAAPARRGSSRPAARSSPTPARLSVRPGGQVVEHDDASMPAVDDQTAAHARADEPGPAGHEHAHGRRRYRRRAMATRVLWLTKGLGPGGTERLLVEMARARDPAIVSNRRWRTSCPGRTTSPASWRRRASTTVCLSTRRRDPRWPLRLRRLVADGGFDVVHSHSPVPAVAARLAVASLPAARRPALVTTEHNTWTSLSARRPAGRTASRAALDAATFAVTEEVRASLRGAPPSAPRCSCTASTSTASPRRPAGERAAVRDGLGLRADDVVIGTVANLRAQKDYPTLLAAARLLVDRGVAFRLVAVGQGPLEREITSPPRRARARRPRRARRVPAGRRRGHGGVRRLRARVGVGGPPGRGDGGRRARPADRGDRGRRHRRAVRARPTPLLVPPRDPVALADALESVLADPVPACGAVVGGEVGGAALRRPPGDRHASPPATSSSPASARLDRRRRRPGDTSTRSTLRPATPDDREQILALLGVSLGWDDDARYRELFAWKHERNPFGPSLAWVVERDGRVVAVRLFMRWDVPAGRVHAARGAGRGHGDAPRPPGPRPVHGADDARPRGVPSRGRGVRVQHPERAEPAGLPQDGLARGRSSPVVGAARAARATSSRSPGAVSRPSAGRCRSTSAPTSRRGSTGAVAGRHRRRCRRRTGRCGRRRMTSSPAGGTAWPSCTTASSTIERRRSSCASDAAAPAWSSWSLTSSATPTAPTDWWSTRSDEFGATHALRLGGPNLRRGFVNVPGAGPILTWRAVCDHGPPPLPNWDLCLGDLELF